MRSKLINLARPALRAVRKLPGAVLLLEPLRRQLTRAVTPGAGACYVRHGSGSFGITVSLFDEIGSQIHWYGQYNRDLLAVLRAEVRRGDVVLDIGANIGEVSLAAAALAGADGQVLAFEPMPSYARQIEADARRNGFTNLQVLAIALGAVAGSAEIHLPAASGTADDGGIINHGTATLFPDAQFMASQRIEVAVLDEVLAQHGVQRVNGIKLDIEGSELMALQGAAATLARHRPWIICELQQESCQRAGYEMEDVLTLLRRVGYRFFNIERKGRRTPLAGLRPFQNLFCVCP